MTPQYDLVTFGEPLVGIYPTTKEDPTLCRLAFGGDTSNVAIAAARLGLSTGILSAVGEDPYGLRFLELWRKQGVDTSLIIVDANRPTGLYVIDFVEGDHRFAYYRKGSAASALCITSELLDQAVSARAFHLSGISQAISTNMCDLSFRALARAREAGAIISYDVNYRPPLWGPDRAGSIAKRTIEEYADIVSINSDELQILSIADSPEAFIHEYGDTKIAIAIRMGAHGAILHMSGKRIDVPSFDVVVRDTVGAGDAFDAGLIAAVLEDMPPNRVAAFASAVAAISCTGVGPTSAHPTREAVATLMSAIPAGT